MEAIYAWVKSFVFYLVFMTMIFSLLPDRKYEKYLRLFAGVVLILLVFSPFADLTGVEERLAGSFERLSFQSDAEALRRDLMEADAKRLEKLLAGYRGMVETDLRTMAEGGGLSCLEAEAVLEEAGESGEFGRLRKVRIRVGMADAAAAEAAVGISAFGAGTEISGSDSGAGERGERLLAANREIAQLKKKIGEYYGLEEGQITIDLETE